MKTIWKYEFSPMAPNYFEMPNGAEILDIQVQNNTPCHWALVDTKQPKETRTFVIHGTGLKIRDQKIKHIKTYQSGLYVWHVFELIK